MSHYLPVDKIAEDLRKAVREFEYASRELKKEQDQLETDMMQALEKQKMGAIKKRLTV